MGLSVHPDHLQRVRDALALRFSSQRELAYAAGVCRTTVERFVSGKGVHRLNFIELSTQLGLDWQEIIVPANRLPIAVNCISNQLNESLDIDNLVVQVRQRCKNKIQECYGQMKLLDTSHPIDVADLYVDVNILEEIPRLQSVGISEFRQQFNPSADNFDRVCLGRVRQVRVPGQEVVKKYRRLMVLGKPGSGKTTFLQHLAIQCNQGLFQTDKVPVFIQLRDFAISARNQHHFKLFDYISQKFSDRSTLDRDITEAILNHGRALILLDGLDEVPSEDESYIITQIEEFSQKFFKNPLIITCRIAASSYSFPNFTDVEVADFNDEQIRSFSEKWFLAVTRGSKEEKLAKARQFIESLNRPENYQIRELAVTPILLHLTCLVFQSRSKFPFNRAKLYQQGLDILLRTWDESRGIQRDEVYRNLTFSRKKQLLAQIAAIMFERGDYFFEQDHIQGIIADYLRTLPDAQTDPDELQTDSEAVLKSIEAQHGLLVERARGIYSFSHLTFQEYFTGKYFVCNSGSQSLPNLVSHIIEKRWREVFLLAVEMLPSADRLLQLMKQQIDALITDNEQLQQFLMWVKQKSISVVVPYRRVAVRAFYFTLDIIRVRVLDLTGVLSLARDLDCNLDLDFDLDLDLNLDLDLGLALNLDPERTLTLHLPLNRAVERAINLELHQELQQLKQQLPNPNSSDRLIEQWLNTNSQAWTEKLRAVMIQYRNIGHDWQFSDEQKELLKQYYNVNKFLVECLNSDCYVSRNVRQEIENTLLLPMSEI
jgi:predicted NACHT family NTPase